MNKKAVIFDLDGTILNTLGDLENSLNYALRKSGLPERTRDEVRRFVGNGVGKLIERSVPEDTDIKIKEQLHADFTEHYSAHYADSTYPYAGITELFNKLKTSGLKTAVVSINLITL
jgi:phosphoglycolate phosphatase